MPVPAFEERINDGGQDKDRLFRAWNSIDYGDPLAQYTSYTIYAGDGIKYPLEGGDVSITHSYTANGTYHPYAVGKNGYGELVESVRLTVVVTTAGEAPPAEGGGLWLLLLGLAAAVGVAIAASRGR